MSVKTTQITTIYSDWKNELDKKELDELNEDLGKMGANIRVYYKADPDGWELKFIKEEIEE